MGDGDGPKAAVDLDRDEQEEQREPGDHLRHHQRRIDEAGEQDAPAEAASARERHRGQRAEDGRGGRGEERDAQAHPGGVEQRLIVN